MVGNPPAFLSTLSLRRATSAAAGKRAGRYYFYPRSPCGERPYLLGKFWDLVGISIHALLAESDGKLPDGRYTAILFLSTLSLRRATRPQPPKARELINFYPRSPCGERRRFLASLSAVLTISIHALLAESDIHDFTALYNILISIHALLAESDVNGGDPSSCFGNFYPRSPCGERRSE